MILTTPFETGRGLRPVSQLRRRELSVRRYGAFIFILSDREGRLLATPGDTSFTGVDEELVDAKPLFSLFAVDDRATFMAALT